MPHQTAPDTRCTFTFRDARRCAMLRAPGSDEYCPHHFRAMLKAEGLLVPKVEGLAFANQLDSPRAIRRAIKRVLHAFENAHITERQARILAQLLRLLLATGNAPADDSAEPVAADAV